MCMRLFDMMVDGVFCFFYSWYYFANGKMEKLYFFFARDLHKFFLHKLLLV